jgi:hypothetical protein
VPDLPRVGTRDNGKKRSRNRVLLADVRKELGVNPRLRNLKTAFVTRDNEEKYAI